MTDLQKFGFKERKDGSLLYREPSGEFAVLIYMSKEGQYGIAIHQRRWSGTYWVPLTASSREAAGLYAIDWLADPIHQVR